VGEILRAASLQKQTGVERLSLDAENLQNGLAKLVLTLVEVIRDLMERQAMRRVESGSLSPVEVEKLGVALMQIKQRMGEISEEFGFKREELGIDLGPLGRLGSGKRAEVTLTDVLDKVIDKGAVVAGEVLISVADVDLIALDILLSLSSVKRLEDGRPVLDLN
jgi:hypothetical protein